MKPADALEGVMSTFSQHVSGGEARYLWQALPAPIRALLESCLIHRDEPARRFGRDELLTRVAEHLHVSIGDAERIASAVLHAISCRLPPKEVVDVAGQLPLELRDLWMAFPIELPEAHPILAEIERHVTLPPGMASADAFTVVTCALSQRLSRGEARHLVQALTPDLRPLVEPCLDGRGEEAEPFGLDVLLARIADELHTDQPEAILRAVIHATEKFLSEQAFKHVRSQLPADIDGLWMAPA
jgi:uncharacterized protein (DUF2267 family)